MFWNTYISILFKFSLNVITEFAEFSKTKIVKWYSNELPLGVRD